MEVHIEQGRVLEQEGAAIGIVTDIVGIHRERITIKGRADHAGATPMLLRAYALVGAARIVETVYARALALSDSDKPLVATVGKLDVLPNAANAVRGEVEMILEVRCGDEAATRIFSKTLIEEVRPSLEALRLEVQVEPVSHASLTPCAPVVREAIRAAASPQGLLARDLPSGAGHDGVFVALTGPISPATILRIVKELPTCVMLKHEDWPGLSKISALRAASDKGERRISILVGNGGMFLPEELGRCADGAMTGFAYPEMMVDVWKAYAAGDVERAHDLFDAYLPLARYEQQPGLGLALRKYTLAKR